MTDEKGIDLNVLIDWNSLELLNPLCEDSDVASIIAFVECFLSTSQCQSNIQPRFSHRQ
jgi:hypothetical protein